MLLSTVTTIVVCLLLQTVGTSGDEGSSKHCDRLEDIVRQMQSMADSSYITDVTSGLGYSQLTHQCETTDDDSCDSITCHGFYSSEAYSVTVNINYCDDPTSISVSYYYQSVEEDLTFTSGEAIPIPGASIDMEGLPVQLYLQIDMDHVEDGISTTVIAKGSTMLFGHLITPVQHVLMKDIIIPINSCYLETEPENSIAANETRYDPDFTTVQASVVTEVDVGIVESEEGLDNTSAVETTVSVVTVPVEEPDLLSATSVPVQLQGPSVTDIPPYGPECDVLQNEVAGDFAKLGVDMVCQSSGSCTGIICRTTTHSQVQYELSTSLYTCTEQPLLHVRLKSLTNNKILYERDIMSGHTFQSQYFPYQSLIEMNRYDTCVHIYLEVNKKHEMNLKKEFNWIVPVSSCPGLNGSHFHHCPNKDGHDIGMHNKPHSKLIISVADQNKGGDIAVIIVSVFVTLFMVALVIWGVVRKRRSSLMVDDEQALVESTYSISADPSSTSSA